MSYVVSMFVLYEVVNFRVWLELITLWWLFQKTLWPMVPV